MIGVARSRLDRRRAPRARARRRRAARRRLDDGDAFDELARRSCATSTATTRGDARPAQTLESSTSATARGAVHYLAIPPACSRRSSSASARRAARATARVVVEKPFGRDLASARELNADAARGVPRGADLPHRPLPRQGGGRRTSSTSASPTRSSSRSGTATTSTACRSRWPRTSASRGAATSTRRRARIRDVIAEPPVPGRSRSSRWSRRSSLDAEALRDEKVKVLRAMQVCDPRDVVRGQFAGYRNEPGVAPDSDVETFAALRCTSTPGAGPACRSSCAPARA